MTSRWDADHLMALAREYQSACVIVATAELDLIPALSAGAMSAGTLAQHIDTNERATAMLADALCSLGLLNKREGHFSPASGISELFDEDAAENVVNMLRHQANCLRSWAQLATVVKKGTRFDRPPSVRGAAEDRRSFIEAMDVACRATAQSVVHSLGNLPFRKLLDIGGGPGTWTLSFLRAHPHLRVIYYDLPEVLPIALRHFESEALLDRIELVAGDFYEDESLPAGADLAWVSAITHQNSREQNRLLYAKVYRALSPGGRILVRDIVMKEDHVFPTAGALFAINMLVNTEAGATYSKSEHYEDLLSAGFTNPTVHKAGRDMDWVVQAEKPA